MQLKQPLPLLLNMAIKLLLLQLGLSQKNRKYLISFSVASTSSTVLNAKLRRRVGTGAIEEMAQIETVVAGTNNVYSYEVEDSVNSNTDNVVYTVTGRADSPGITDSLSVFQLTIKKVG